MISQKRPRCFPRAMLGVLIVLGTSFQVHGQDDPRAGRITRPASYRVDFKVAVTPPAKTKVLKVWVPIPQSGLSQTISDRSLTSFPMKIEPVIATEPKFGNQFAYFEFHSPKGGQLISHSFAATVSEVNWQVDYGGVESPAKWPDSVATYQRMDPRAQDQPQVVDVMRQIGNAAKPSQLIQAMKWIDGNLTYDHSNASLSANPMHGLIQRRGHCSDFHGLCSTLAQNVGYPARVCYGLQMFDKASPSHCKLEVYLPPYGWIPYDLSETQKLVKRVLTDDEFANQDRGSLAAKIRQRTLDGFRENTWLKMTHGVNYELVPAASSPVNVVRTIYAEADGVMLREPDPSDPNQTGFSWMTMHHVEESSSAAKKFGDIRKDNAVD